MSNAGTFDYVRIQAVLTTFTILQQGILAEFVQICAYGLNLTEICTVHLTHSLFLTDTFHALLDCSTRLIFDGLCFWRLFSW